MKLTSERLHKLSAWAVHLFTATGIICGFQACIAIYESQWSLALSWLFLALLIDGIDGTIARYVNVNEVLPNIDGKMLDYVIDFVNFVFLPTLFIYLSIDLPDSFKSTLISLMLIASCFHYANLKAVENNQYFIGYPAFWNIIAFYLFVLNLNQYVNALIIFVVVSIHFTPIKFLYLSHLFKTNRIAAVLSLTWILLILGIISSYPENGFIWVTLSFLLIVFYVIYSNIHYVKIQYENDE